MCRYGFKIYKSHFACFNCRKIFRKPPIQDYLEQRGLLYIHRKLRFSCYNKTRLKELETEFKITLDQLESKYAEQICKCPQCDKVMADLGQDIKAPKKTDLKSWKILEGMYRIGHCFHTCGCNGIGYVPQSHSDYIAYLEQRLTQYQSTLARVSNEFGDNLAQKRDAQIYWAEKISKIEQEIHKQGLVKL